MKEEISLQIDNEEIIFIETTNRENVEFIIISKSRNVYVVDYPRFNKRLIGTLEFLFEYSEDLFKYSELIGFKKDFLQIHSYKNYVCIVQKFGQNGIVFNLENPEFQKVLKRGDYCVEHCTFPIAFYSNQDFTYIIHGTDWNRLDITCLENDELITDRIVDYEANSNYLDYFHSSLSMSPDEKHFTSNGWVWHPYGQITLFSIDDFLKNFELSYKDIDLAEDCYSFDWDRPLCWIDEKTLAVGFSKNTENYGKTNFADEILFIDTGENKIVNRIEFNGFVNTSDGDVLGNLFFDRKSSRLFSLNEKKGLFVSNLEGKQVFNETSFKSNKYSVKHKLFYRIKEESQIIETMGLENI